MRLPNLVRAAGGVLLLALLSGCVPTDASPQPEPTPTFVAPYASDEEALAAAEEAYAEYLRVINVTLRTAVVDEALFKSVAVGAELADAVSVYSRIAKEGKYSTADITFDQTSLQRYSTDGSPKELVTIYVCEDLSKAYLLDSDGNRVKDQSVPPRIVQISFDYSVDQETLLLSDRQPWVETSC
ncbi:hypothetical protein FB472_0696 [Rhodoglobus vestalii]|uniref:Lipoprotein n=1 Tax=Rhodoglobus vestalii TaxID=193384 RepID=A0A8H2K6Z7_9MICO|nr:hypothetical protein [Rhodoglobus vestalii]TQO19157.1 hypothetical protein FB472_0696 [Rhodoglobus vestalii]